MSPHRSRSAEGRLLVVLPNIPSGAEDAAPRAALRELAGSWELDLIPAQPSRAETALLASLGARLAESGLLARCREAAGAKSYDAVVVFDGASTRAVVEPLKGFARKPVVLAVFGERPTASLSGDGFLKRRAEREAAARGAACADAVWTPAGGKRLTDALRTLGRAQKARGLVSIIIPCFNGLAYTKECLEAVAKHTTPPYELIVVDNASTDGTVGFAKKAGAKVIRNRENLGFAKAINQGMRAAKGKYLVWLNNDVVVTPGWLDRLVACADRAPWIGAAGPCTDETVGFQKVEAPEFKTPKELVMFSEAWALRHAGQAEGVHRLTGFLLLVKREALDRVGMLDERFAIGTYEEFDYCLRLRQAGYDLAVARDVFVRHHGHKSFKGFQAMADRARVNRDVFLDKWCHQALAFLDELNPESAAGSR